jgi:uncharacterized protein (DUF1330 family)
MAKGYWIAQVDVTDPAAYAVYAKANQLALTKFGARYLVRAGQAEVLEGSARSRLVILEFPDYASALACYRSPEYAAAIAIRSPASVADLVVVEGYDGTQPGA